MVIQVSGFPAGTFFVYSTVESIAAEIIPSDPKSGMLLSYHLLIKSQSSSLEESEEV